MLPLSPFSFRSPQGSLYLSFFLCLSSLTGVTSTQNRPPFPFASSSSDNCGILYVPFQAKSKWDRAYPTPTDSWTALAKTKSGHPCSLCPPGPKLFSHISPCQPPGLLEQTPFTYSPNWFNDLRVHTSITSFEPYSKCVDGGSMLLSPSEKNKDLNPK